MSYVQFQIIVYKIEDDVLPHTKQIIFHLDTCFFHHMVIVKINTVSFSLENHQMVVEVLVEFKNNVFGVQENINLCEHWT